jgi:hypothetical protein
MVRHRNAATEGLNCTASAAFGAADFQRAPGAPRLARRPL